MTTTDDLLAPDTVCECLKATLTRREPRVFTFEARGPSLARIQAGDFGEIKEVLAKLEAECVKTPEARFRRYSGPGEFREVGA